MSPSPTTAIILAAGLGTRMRSKLPKVLHQAGGAALIAHVVETALEITTPDRVIAVVGHQAGRVRECVASNGIQFALQTEPNGTGHALAVCAGIEGVSDGRVVVLYGDVPLLRVETIRELMRRQADSGCAAVVLTARVDNPHGYGRIVRDAAGHISAIVEEKAASAEQRAIQEINSGIYCFDAPLLWQQLAGLKPNPASGEIYLTDIVESLRTAGHATAAYLMDDPREILGINTRVELAAVDRIFRERKTTELMLAGVTIERPESVMIDRHVTVGQDTLIGPEVQLRGRTQIGSGCAIGQGAILNDAVIHDDAIVFPYTLIDTSTLGKDAHAGPFARLRMHTELGPKAHVGNFVELKNTHLGAGTITCNYDGVKKHRTNIGDGSFIGSNSTLVAPIDVASGSYVAAGSVITKPVPADALAIGRAHQFVKEGWAKKRREESGK